MNELEYQLVENELKAKDFIRLKVATGFMDRPIEQVEKALKNYEKFGFSKSLGMTKYIER